MEEINFSSYFLPYKTYTMTDKKFIYNYVLVHTARTWERLRVSMPNQEMPIDNIGSVDEIIKVAEHIYSLDIIQVFINATEDVKRDYWFKNTHQRFSDVFIEETAEQLISDWYL